MFLYDFFFVKQKTAYEMRISDWSSDVCSSDLDLHGLVTPDDETLSAGALGPNQAYVSQDLAEEIQVEAGGTVNVRYQGEGYDFEVVDIIQDKTRSARCGESVCQYV